MAIRNPTISDAAAHDFASILKPRAQSETANVSGIAVTVNQAFDRLILQSGSAHSSQSWLIACGCVGLLCGTVTFAKTSHLLLTAAVFLIGVMLPIIAAMIKKKQRQRRLVEQLPSAIESISRNCVAGHNFESALRQTAQNIKLPLGEELESVVNEINIGIVPAQAIDKLHQRTGVAEMSLFSSTVSLHQQHGGNVVTMLERLSLSMRERLHFEKRARSATTATRLGTTLMLGLPPCIVAYYSFQDGSYLPRLIASSAGRLSVFTAIGLQIVGAISVYRILKDSGRP